MSRILIIDDNPQIVVLLTTILEPEGHTILTACNGKEGIRILVNETVDLVITDIVMPDMDGIEVLMSLKRMPNRPKVIVMSGGSPALDQDIYLNIARMMKAELVLAKPLQFHTITKQIHDVLDK